MYYTKQLENLRIDADKTQQQIADILICQREVYRRYEKGERKISSFITPSPLETPLSA